MPDKSTVKRAKRLDHRAAPADAPPPISRRQRWLVIGVLALVAGLGVWWRGGELGHVRARRALANRHPDVALDWLKWTGRYFGPNAETHLLFARAYRKLGQISATQDSLRLAVATGIDEGRLLREEVLLRAQTGQFREAEPYFSKLLAEPLGEEAEIFESFAIGFILNGHLAEAIQVTDAWEAKLPRDARPCYLRGVMHRDVGWPAQAEAEFRKALDREPQFAEASLELAILLMRSQRYEEAVEHYGRALAKPGHEAKVFVGLAHCYRMLGDVDAAREVLQPLVRSSSPNVGALAEMGSIELMAGNYEQALRWIEQARTSIPRNSELSYAYGSTLAALKRHDDAAEPFEFAIQARRAARKIKELTDRVNARPEDLATRCTIAQLSLDYGDPRNAAGWAQSVLERDPNNAPAREILTKLQQPAGPPAPVGPPAPPVLPVPPVPRKTTP